MLRARRAAILLLILLPALVLAACDGLFTGEQVVRFPLRPVSGGFAPIILSLGPEMNPVALNFAAEYTVNPAEAGQWNAYVAVLKRNGNIVASAPFNINNNSTPDAPSGAASVARTMLVFDAPETGDYELSIAATAPARVTMVNPNVELRRKVRRDGQAR